MSSRMDLGGVFHFPWVILCLVLVIAFAGLYFGFLLRLPKDTQKLVLLGAILYVSVIIGFKMLNGAWKDVHGRSMLYYLLTTAEELLEMSGCIVFIYAFSN